MPFRALVVLTFVMLLAPQSFIPVLAPFRLALVAATVAAAAHLYDRWAHGRSLIAIGPELRVSLLLVGWAVITMPWSLWPGGSMGLLLDTYLKSIVTFWLLGSIIRTPARLRQIAWTLSLIALPLALTALSHFLAGDFRQEAQSRINGYEGGLVKNPNDLALVLNMILPLTVSLVVTERSRLRLTLLAAIVACEVAGIVATFSRTGFLTLAVIGALLVWRMGRRPGARWLWIGLTVACLALPLLPARYLARLSTITDTASDPTGSAQSRWSDQVVAAGHISAHPVVGAGIGNDHLAMNTLRGSTWLHVHNAYLVYAIDLGLPGLALFVAFIWRCLASVHAVRKGHLGTHGNPVLVAAAEGVSTSLLALGVAAFFHPISYHVYVYYIAGLAVAVKATDAAEGHAA